MRGAEFRVATNYSVPRRWPPRQGYELVAAGAPCLGAAVATCGCMVVPWKLPKVACVYGK